MSSWSQRRKATYASIVIAIAAVIIGIPAYLVLYTPPSCSDGKQNGTEQGVDCGGGCQRLCSSAFLPPATSWARYEQIAPGLYNVAAYIVNPNRTGEASRVPYHLALYDSNGLIITDKTGTITLPPGRNTLAFLPAVQVAKREPAKVLFEFTAAPDWHSRTDPLSDLTIKDKQYSDEDGGSSLVVTLGNTSNKALGPVAVYAALYDIDGNAIGFSKTSVDRIEAKSTAIAPFTWPTDRLGRVVSIEVLPVLE